MTPSFLRRPVLFPLAILPGGLLGLTMLSGCGSSDSPMGGQPPMATELPDDFVVFMSDRGTAEVQRPFLVDLSTNEKRPVTASLPVGVDLVRYGSQLSPDGRYLVVSLDDQSERPTRIIDLTNGETRTIQLGGGVGGPAFNNDRGDDDFVSRFLFSGNSEHALIQVDLEDTFLTDSDGRNPVPLRVDGERVTVVQWLGDTSRLLVRSVDPVTSYDRLTVLNAATGATTSYTPAPGEEVYLDDIVVSRDLSVAAVAMEIEIVGGGDELEVATIELATGATTRWSAGNLDEEFVALSDDGAFVAFVTLDETTGAQVVTLAERATGAAQVVSLSPDVPAETTVESLSFEPGGTRLAFSSNHSSEDIEEITLASFGSPSMLIQPAASMDSEVESFTWSPDGRYLAFILDESSEPERAYVFDADSTAAPIRITDSPAATDAYQLAWSPDGSYLLVTERSGVTQTPVTAAYEAGSWGTRRELGEAWTPAQPSPFLEAAGHRQLDFDASGSRLIWRGMAGPQSQPRALWIIELDDQTGAAAVDLTGGFAGAHTPDVPAFWVR